jgi:O-antigen/teichoic acid export membrane protein
MTSEQPFSSIGDMENDGSLSRRAVKSGVFVTISKVIRYGFTFITHLILLNLLSPADFGMMRYVTVVLGFINLINDAGFKYAIVQKKHVDKGEIFSSFLLSILFGAMMYVAIFLVAPLVASFTGDPQIIPLIRVGGIAAFTGGASVIQRGLMQRQFRFARLSLIDIICAVAGSSSGIALALNGKGVWALVSSIVVYNSLMFLFCTTAAGIPFRSAFNFRSTFAVMSFGFKDILSKIFSYASVNLDYIIIGRYFGEQILGIYGFAYSVMLIVNTAFGILFNDIGISLFSRLQGDPKKSGTLFLKMTQAVTLVTVPYVIIIMLSASGVVEVISFVKHNHQWAPSIPYLVQLAPVGLFYTFAGFPAMVWTANGLNRLRIFWQLLSLFTVVIAILIGAHFGPVQVCTALLIRAVVMLPVSIYVNSKYTGVTPLSHLKILTAPVTCGVIAIVVALVLHNITFFKEISNGWQSLSIDVSVIVSVYVGSIWLFFRSIFTDLEKLFSLAGLGWVFPWKQRKLQERSIGV